MSLLQRSIGSYHSILIPSIVTCIVCLCCCIQGQLCGKHSPTTVNQLQDNPLGILNHIEIKRFAKSNIPLGLLSFTLLHELVVTGAATLVAPLISSAVIIKTGDIVKCNPEHQCCHARLLHVGLSLLIMLMQA